MARAARAAGYEILGFSSHAPLPHHVAGNLPAERLDDYVAEIRRLKADWAPGGGEAQAFGAMEILLGLEIDWYPGLRTPGDGAFDRFALDYRIGSVHTVDTDGRGAYTVDGPAEELEANIAAHAGGDAEPVWRDYYRRMAAMVEAGGFDILGHFDLVKKNNAGGRFFDEGAPGYLAAAFEAAATLEGKDIVAEINLGGMARGKTREPYPSLPILRELRRRGVRITWGADAHEPAHLGAHLEAGRELARAAGYDSVAVLSGGSWREVGLGRT